MLDWSDAPFAKWFVGGKLNVAYNCVDRHVEAGHGDQVAYHWEGEPGDTRTITYAELKDEVCKAANALVELGVQTGDRVAIYMPMIPETVIAMLACARLGAPHTVVFGGFSSTALSDRIIDCDARVVITADGGYRRGAPSALKPAVDEALQKCPDVRSVLVVKRTEQDVEWNDGRDVWWHDVVDRQSTEHELRGLRRRAPALRHVHLRHDRQAEGHPAHVRRLPDPGGVHAPRGVRPQARRRPVLVRRRHRLGHRPQLHRLRAAGQPGHVVHVRGHAEHARTSTAGGTMIEKYKITILYTAPTTIRTFMKWGEDIPAAHDLSSLRLLGSVGEPINPEAWIWYRKNIGGDRTPVVDTWWQTETGAIMISPLPGVTETKPGSATQGRCPASAPTSSTTTATRCPTAAAASWCSPSRGRR